MTPELKETEDLPLFWAMVGIVVLFGITYLILATLAK